MEETDILAERFGVGEYLVFGAVLACSTAVGIFYGCSGSRQASNEEFLMGNRKMTPFPVALSLVCSFQSAISILGNPVELYLYGIQYSLILVVFIPLTLTLAYLYVPVFLTLKLTSAFEYFELRFNSKRIRRFISVISILDLIVYMPMAVYSPALALSQVTGIHHRISVVAIFIVCIFYSTLGGLKAVLWTDAFQCIIMIGSLALIVFKGVADVGGLSFMWEKVQESQRDNFLNFDFDPRTRHTVWTSLFGGYFFWLTLYAASQANIQRFSSLPDLAAVKKCLAINVVALYLLLVFCLFTGPLIFARYFNCDPVTIGRVSTSDQLLPLFVMDTLGEYTTLPGIFVAGITCASLSSVSSGLNSLAAVITEDYVKQWKSNLSDEKLSFISKMICLTSGVLSLSLVFVVERMENILPVTVSLVGVVSGPALGIFTLGMFFPWANSRGASLGLGASFCFMLFLCIGSPIIGDDLPDQRLSLSTEGCAHNGSLFPSHEPIDWKGADDGLLKRILSVSYLWYPVYGTLTALLVGLMGSFVFSSAGFSDKIERKVLRKCSSPPLVNLWTFLFPSSVFALLGDGKGEEEPEGSSYSIQK